MDPQSHPPPPGHDHPLLGVPPQGEWSTGLFDCTSDVHTCCMTTWCPWITFGQNVEIIDRGMSSCGVSGALYALLGVVTGCQCIYACAYRTKLKRQYGIPRNYVQDVATHLFCHPCALCQEQRELEQHGFDVPLGWYGNMERQSRGYEVAKPPIVPGGMTR